MDNKTKTVLRWAAEGAAGAVIGETVKQAVRHRKNGEAYAPVNIAKIALVGIIAAPLQRAMILGLRQLLGLPVTSKK
jgi:hypothetical protein